ncbi:MAG: hypothetical protein VX976_02430 [Pseudomonadota bacterium]|nr:hypothetical protein [Pseudomonadota bacterium]
MKFLSFFFIFLTIILTISIKLLITNQETTLKRIDIEISKIQLNIEKLKTDISYATRPQKLKKINEEEFKFSPIHQKDIMKLEQ